MGKNKCGLINYDEQSIEIIEAKNMFNVDYENLKILIHPKSYVHAIIQFKGGMIKIVAHLQQWKFQYLILYMMMNLRKLNL